MDEPWYDKFVEALLSPDLAAEAVFTLVSVIIAFAGAAALVQRQLAHDRRLFREQLLADRANQGAARRAEVARTLGRALIDAASELANYRPEELEKALRESGLDGRSVPGAEKMYLAYKLAVPELDLDNAILDLWSTKLRWWRAVASTRDTPEARRLSASQRSHMLASLLAIRFAPIDQATERLGRRLMKWDGGMLAVDTRGGTLPSSPRPPSLSPFEKLDLVTGIDTDQQARRAAREQVILVTQGDDRTIGKGRPGVSSPSPRHRFWRFGRL